MKAGIGYDIHKLVKGRKLILGGIEIPHSKGLSGHTDGDVIIHAIIDAILGASALGDIGKHFPDTDPKWKDAKSIDLLEVIHIGMKNKGLKVNNIDVTVIAEEPTLSKYTDPMCKLLAQILEVKANQINIKSKTNEGQDSIGNKDAICAHAIATVE